MAKKRVFMVMALALLSTVFAAGMFAQVTVSAGLALSSLDAEGNLLSNFGSVDTEIGIGGNLYADYLLPVGIPLSLGFEFGVDTAKFSVSGGGHTYKDTITVLPLLLRAAYHFDLLANLDLYLVGKIGYAVGFWGGNIYDALKNYIDSVSGVAFGFDIGAAYYFTPVFGVFAEAGFDDYALEVKVKGGYTGTAEMPFYRFLTFGVSTKF
jgi:hypothetical protein